jgi:hypothetical protein
MGEGVGWAAQQRQLRALQARMDRFEQGRPDLSDLVRAMTHALQPLADLVHRDAGELPDSAIVTRGNPLVGQPITAGQCKQAAILIARAQKALSDG